MAGVSLVFPLIMLMQTMSARGNGGGVFSAIARAIGADRRERHWELTPAGRRQFLRARGLWDRAQTRLRAALGQAEWDALQTTLKRVTEAALRS